MTQHSRLFVFSNLIETGLVPLFYHPNADTACRIVSACLDGGAHCIEFTNRGIQAQHVFEKLVREFDSDSRLILGAGSVVEAGTASLYMQLGASFIVSPLLNPDILRSCNRRKVACLPGCGSVTEISQAEELGAEICKIFPGNAVGGTDFIKSVRAPMPWANLMPTGGVEPTNESISKWFDAGVCAVGIGSKLIQDERVAEGNFKAITDLVKSTLTWIQASRGRNAP